MPDVAFEFLGFILVLLGILGSFLPILPGPITGWLGLLLLHQSSKVAQDTSFLVTTFVIALVIFLLDYVIPALGTKKFGGSKFGVIGSSVGLLIGLLFLGPFGIIVGPFVGAFLGETLNKTPRKKAFRAAFGSLVGFLSGVFLKFTVSLIFCVQFIRIYWGATIG